MTFGAERARPDRRERALLVVLLLVGGLLRFAHLGAGLRHTPHMDERYFVENAAHMLATRSLDWRWYEYPGLMFYLLVPVQAAAGAGEPPGPEGYLAARAFVAACGLLAIALAWAFARRLGGPVPAALTAALLAVSPVHVETAHMLRPDVTLECLMLALFLAILRLDGSARRDLAAGAALGLAAGLKFSGALGLVPLTIAVALRPGRRLRPLVLAGAGAAVVFVVSSPYLVLAGAEALRGIGSQVLYHYQAQPTAPEPYLSKLLAYGSVWPKALGWPAAALALVGLARARDQWRRLAPFVPLPLITAMLFATTGYFFNRHMIPSMSIVALLAGLGLDVVHRRGARLGWAIGALCLVPPLQASLGYLNGIGRASTRDRAADWMQAHLTAPARVLSTVPALNLDAGRFEVLRPKRLEAGAQAQALLGEVDAVASLDADEPLFDGPPAARIAPGGPWEGPQILLRGPLARSVTEHLPLAGARLSASGNEQALDAVRDGSIDTFWEISPGRGERTWIEVQLAAAARLTRVELKLGSRPDDAGRGLSLEAALEDGHFHRVPAWHARPPTREQLSSLTGYSEILVFAPAEARRWRIVRQAGARRWSVAELELGRAQP